MQKFKLLIILYIFMNNIYLIFYLIRISLIKSSYYLRVNLYLYKLSFEILPANLIILKLIITYINWKYVEMKFEYFHVDVEFS